MKHHDIYELLNNLSVSKVLTRKWIEFNDLSSVKFFVNRNITFKIPILRSSMCHYGDAYIVAKRRITVEGTNSVNRTNKKVTFRNIVPVRYAKI